MNDADARPDPGLNPPERILMGPGPSNVPPEVLRAMAIPTIGHLDPVFLEIMDETMARLRALFRTDNELTFPVSGTGSAAMEAALCNVVEPGDTVVVGINGVFGGRMRDICGRCGAEVRAVEAPWGEPIDPGRLIEAATESRAKVLAVVHAETSTGVAQPIEPLGAALRDTDTILLVDAVTSLGGMPVEVDAWGIDVCYSGAQKCLSCPPGISPITFGPKARAAIARRREKVRSWYLDVTMIERYLGSERLYHHTAPINMVYALHRAVGLILEEGLDARFKRHLEVHEMLVDGLAEIPGLEMAVRPEARLPMLNSVRVGGGIDEAALRRRLLEEHSIEIGGGLGALKGETVRIGIMGHSCTPGNVRTLLAALRSLTEDGPAR
jgi:alanine-glyoxylate transaminase/serine-glyoxylate transaminase/serine-pyruvate transaminase